MVYLLLANGFEEIEALCPVDLLRRANQAVCIVSLEESNVVTSSHGVKVVADALAAEVDLEQNPPKMLILPGGMPGSTHLDENEQTDRFLAAAVEADAYLAAICAAPLVLGHRGLLMDRRATCYPGFEKAMLGAQAVPYGVVQDGKCITASGMGLSEPFALRLVMALCGEQTATALAKSIAPYRGKDLSKEWEN